MDILELDVPCKLQFLTGNEGTKRPPLVVSKNLTFWRTSIQPILCHDIMDVGSPGHASCINNNNNYQTSLFSHTTLKRLGSSMHDMGTRLL